MLRKAISLIRKGIALLGSWFKKISSAGGVVGICRLAKQAYDFMSEAPFCLHANTCMFGIEGYLTIRSEIQPATPDEFTSHLVIEKSYGTLVFLRV